MKSVADELTALRQAVERAEQERVRLKGEYDAGIKRLREDFGVNDLEEAKALLEKQQAQIKEDGDALDEEVQALQETVYGQLESNN